jgi:hypothetical protein
MIDVAMPGETFGWIPSRGGEVRQSMLAKRLDGADKDCERLHNDGREADQMEGQLAGPERERSPRVRGKGESGPLPTGLISRRWSISCERGRSGRNGQSRRRRRVVPNKTADVGSREREKKTEQERGQVGMDSMVCIRAEDVLACFTCR